MEIIKNFLKQLGGLATDLRHKYSTDIFFRTTIYIVGLQAALVITLVVIFGISLKHSSQEVERVIVSYIAKILENREVVTPEALYKEITDIQNTVTLWVFLGIIGLAIISGFILSYFTLRPARNSLKNQKLFISNVAHELRTPLSTIKTSTEVLLLDDKLSKDTTETLRSIVEELNRASEIINNLLSLNRLLRPERIEFKKIDIGEALQDSLKRLLPLAKARGIEIIVERNKERGVWGNSSALEQVITNIVRNSISYMPPEKDGVIRISIVPNFRGSIALTISDNGIGISSEDLVHILEPFYRADTSRSRLTQVQKRGSGLGLAIVNEIVRVHHGKIIMESKLGRGTSTTILIPQAPEN